jgi:hypothetical protein
MNKSLIRRISIWVSCVIIVLAVGGYFAMDYGVDYVLRMVASPEIASSVAKDTDPVQTVKEVEGKKASDNSKGTASEKPPTTSKNEVENSSGADGSASPSKEIEETNESGSTDLKPKTAEIEPAKEKTQDKPYDGRVTPEKIENAENQITLKEKTKVTTSLLSSLSAKDISLFMSMSASGMSIEEKKAAKKIVLQRLTEEQYDELIVIAAKLGLSQGKSYAESLKEYDNLVR